MTSPKLMNFWKSSKRPLTPLIFGKSCCAFRDKIATKVRMFSMAGQFNMVLPLNWLKTYPKKTLLYHFHAEKALFKAQNLQHKFLDWK